VLAMDQSNLNALLQMGPESELKNKLFLFRTFDPENNNNLEVPDPYYGGDNGFEMVYQIVERTCPKVLEYLKIELTKKT
jgi:protein-tyrosine phosphatase